MLCIGALFIIMQFFAPSPPEAQGKQDRQKHQGQRRGDGGLRLGPGAAGKGHDDTHGPEKKRPGRALGQEGPEKAAPGVIAQVELPQVQEEAQRIGPLGGGQGGGKRMAGASAPVPQPQAEHRGQGGLEVKGRGKSPGGAGEGPG